MMKMTKILILLLITQRIHTHAYLCTFYILTKVVDEINIFKGTHTHTRKNILGCRVFIRRCLHLVSVLMFTWTLKRKRFFFEWISLG
jgi:hypothetical protein